MAIKIAQKPKIKTIALNILFYFSLFLVLISVSGFFILDYYKGKDSETLKNLEAVLAKEKTSEEAAMEKEISEYRKKINDFSSLIKSRENLANFLPFIESKTHPQVQWTAIDLNLKDFQVSLSGTTENLQTLQQQILIFKNEKLIEDFNMSGFSAKKGEKINFDFKFSLSPEIFK